MWKLIVGFVIFAAVAVFILVKAGGDVDMGGEKHSVEAPGHDKPAAAAPAASGASAPN